MPVVTGQQEALGKRPVHASGFRLGVVEVDPGIGTVTGPGGNVHLDPKVLDVLHCLVSADGEVVSRETLMSEVWGDVIVTDFALSRCIYQLRKNLMRAADSDESPIQTLSKRGYRLNWPVGDIVPEQSKVNKNRKQTIAFISAFALVFMITASFWAVRNQPAGSVSIAPRVEVEDIRPLVYGKPRGSGPPVSESG